ncbi:MAG: hypothetical protein HY901_33710 [Deltaproteobacteria bacterium]|nr:hypothetical protein [Deltaproteobacteria bacterium]
MKGLVAAVLLLPALAAGQTPPPPPPYVEATTIGSETKGAPSPGAQLPYIENRPVGQPSAPTPPLPQIEPRPAAAQAPAATSAPPPLPLAPAPAAIAPVPVPVVDTPPSGPAPDAQPMEAPLGAQEQPVLAPVPPPMSEPPTQFVKGELTSLGVDRLITKRSRVVVSAGYNHMDQTEYLLVHPQVGLKLGDFALGVGVPLNIEIFSSAYPKDPKPGENHIAQFQHAGDIRKADWDEPGDYARILTYLTYGNKEDHLYIDIGKQHASSIGHGSLMRRYNGNIDVDRYRGGAQFDAYNDYAGVEFMTNDVVMWEVMGALAFVKPLSLFLDHWFAKSLSLGVSAALDRSAPTRMKFMDEPACPVSNACARANVPMVDDRNRLMTETGLAVLGGIDLEAKIVKTESVDIKPFLDYSRFVATGIEGAQPGGAFTVGVLGRFNLGKDPTHAFRLVGELRFIQDGYRPGYFDTFYEIDKALMMGTGGVQAGSGGVPLTKLQATVGDATRAPAPGGTGYYIEASYGVRDAIGLTLALEGTTASAAKDFVAHFELPVLTWLQLFGTLYVRGFEDFGTIVAFDEHAVAFAGVRLKPLPILFLNLRAYKSFQLDAYKGATGPLGTLQFENSVGYAGDIGFGWEF